MVRPGSGRFEVGFWVGFRVGLRARDSPTEEVLSRTPLIIRTVDQNMCVKSPLDFPPDNLKLRILLNLRIIVAEKYLNPLPKWCKKENDFKSHINVIL